MRHAAIDIPGYRVLEEVGRGVRSIVYRAEHHGKVCALKVRAEGGGDDDEARRFAREAGVLASLVAPGLAAVHDVGEIGGRSYLARDFVEGESLDRVLRRLGRVSQPLLLQWAITLAETLTAVHERGLVHRDLKPQNILIDVADRPTIIDFGFVAHTGGSAANEVAGTFRYSAPEQTGMLKRPVDARADLYSLGVVLYECAAGEPPFRSHDIGELIRQHAVTPPPPIGERSAISPAFCAIVHKLLAKDADDRYQSAVGLADDLRRLDELGELAPDQLARALDRRDAIGGRPSGVFVGRSTVLDKLTSRCESARGGLVLLEAGAGMGRTRTVAELAECLRARGVLVLEGACIDGSSEPFFALRRAFDRMAARLDVDSLSLRARAALADAGPWLSQLSPRLTSALGGAPEHGSASPAEESGHDEYYQLIADALIDLFSEAPGALVIDDLHLADPATKRVVRQLVSGLRDSQLTVVATVDSTTVEGASARDPLLDDLRAKAQRLSLPPMSEVEVAELLKELLGGNAVGDEVCGELVARSAGNPLALHELVRALLDAGLLRPSWGAWVLDRANLHKVELTSDVLDLVERRLDLLEDSDKLVLTQAALVGPTFKTDLMLRIIEGDPDAVLEAIAKAVEHRLVLREQGDSYAFVHARAREALLAKLPDSEVRAGHQRIGVALSELGADNPDLLFAIAQHLARGEVGADPQRAYESNQHAGRYALARHALDDAFSFLTSASDIAREHKLPADARLDEALGEVCAHTGRTVLALDHYAAALRGYEHPLDRARVNVRATHVHLGVVATDAARATLENALAEAGASLQRWGIARWVVTLCMWIAGVFVRRTGLGFGGVKGRRRERLLIVAEAYELFGLTAFFCSETALMLHMALRPLYTATRIGRSRALVRCYGNYSCLLAMIGARTGARRYAREAMDVASDIGDPSMLAHATLYTGVTENLLGDAIAGERMSLEALDRMGNRMDAGDYTNGCGDLAWNYYTRGYFREALSWSDRAIIKVRTATGSQGVQPANMADAGALNAMLGNYSAARSLLDLYASDVDDARDPWRARSLQQGILCFHLASGNISGEVEDAIRLHAAWNISPRTCSHHQRFFYVVKAYTRLSQLDQAIDDRAERIAAFKDVIKEFAKTGGRGILAAHLAVLRASYYSAIGKERQSRRWLARAESMARSLDAPWVMLEAAYLRARTLIAAGNEAAARREGARAVMLAAQIGWHDRARRIRAELNVGDTLMKSGRGGVVHVSQAPSESSIGTAHYQRQLRALLDISLASSETRDPARHAAIVLDEIVRILAAERAFLFVCESDAAALSLIAARDANGNDLDETAGYSSSLVNEVRSIREAIVLTGAERGELSATESVVAHGLRSRLAAPLIVRNEMRGVIYLDNRLAKGVFGNEDIDILLALAQQIAIGLETARAAKLDVERAELEKDLALTATVQSLFLPLEAEYSADGFSLVGHYEPAAGCSGDWWWYERREDGSLRVLLGDVMGHGAGAAMVTAAIASSYRTASTDLGVANLRDVLPLLNSAVLGLHNQSRMTLAAIEIDAARRHLTWHYAGAPPIFFSPPGQPPRPLSARSSPLGDRRFAVRSGAVDIEPGSRLLAFTDGVPESPSANGRGFGMRRLMRVFEDTRDRSAADLRDVLLHEVARVRGRQKAEDDLTFVVIDVA